MRHQQAKQENKAWKLGRRLFLAGLVVSASGCKNMIQRGQSPDQAVEVFDQYSKKEVKGTRYVRDVCGIFGLDYKKIHGIGLAVDLQGTGSAPIESGQREHLIRELKKRRNVDEIDELLTSTNTELVIIQGKLPPGIREGDNFDLEVVTMSDSEATSLEGGMILQTELRPIAKLGRGLKKGNIAGLARGRILVNALFEARKDGGAQLHGVVLGGGKAMEDRPLGLRINSKEFNQKTTIQIAQAINKRFKRTSSLGKDGVASPKTDRIVTLEIPDNYTNNIGRYVSVIHHMSFVEARADRAKRLDELGRQMSDPAQAGLAALRLEGLGRDGIPVLKQAMGHQDLEVRFRAAEALAYLGKIDGVETLKHAADVEPAFRWHAFAALTSINDSAATDAIIDLLHVTSAETRYGAFQSLLVQSPSDPRVQGQWLGGDFYLHSIDSESTPMVHFSRIKRPEIVVFGDQQTFADHFLFVQPGLTVKSNGNGTVSITRYTAEFGDETQTCSNRVVDVVEALGEMGLGYADQLNLFRDAKKGGMLSGRLVVNATPKLGRKRSVALGLDEPEPEKSNRFISSQLPELFRTHDNSDNSSEAKSASKAKGDANGKAASKETTGFSKLRNWFTRSE